MTSWLGGAATEDELLSRLPVLSGPLAALRADAAAACPGRTADLIAARTQQIVTGTGSLDGFGPLDAAEQAVIDVAEQFLLDVHGISDELMARLGEHFAPAEQIALMFQLAFADGFTKFRHVFEVP
ncbi:MAG: hypothetical protein U0Q03_04615 [Acidimicrobiales bacterium]